MSQRYQRGWFKQHFKQGIMTVFWGKNCFWTFATQYFEVILQNIRSTVTIIRSMLQNAKTQFSLHRAEPGCPCGRWKTARVQVITHHKTWWIVFGLIASNLAVRAKHSSWLPAFHRTPEAAPVQAASHAPKTAPRHTSQNRRTLYWSL